MPSSSLQSWKSQGKTAAEQPFRRDHDAGSAVEANDKPPGSLHVTAPRWPTTQHTSDIFQPRSSVSPHRKLPLSGQANHLSSMPRVTSPSGCLCPRTSNEIEPSFRHRYATHPHASQQAGSSRYGTSSGDQSRSLGSPTSPMGSPGHSRSSRTGSHGTDAAIAKNEHTGPSTSTEAQCRHSRRRTRVLMTREQSTTLTRLWDQTMFPSTAEREMLADQIGLTSRQVQVWFQNQRQKRRRERGTDDVVRSQDPADMLAPSMGGSPSAIPSSAIPAYPPQARMPSVSMSYRPPLHAPGIVRNMPLQPTSRSRGFTHPYHLYGNEWSPDEYGQELSDSHLFSAGWDSNGSVPSSWLQRSPHLNHLSKAHGGSGNTARSDDSAGLTTAQESHIDPHRRLRSSSTSRSYRKLSNSTNSPRRSSREMHMSPNTQSQSLIFARGRAASMDYRLDHDLQAYYPHPTNQTRTDPRGSISMPTRVSQLPPSLACFVITSPFERGAGLEATTLRPLNLQVGQDDASMASSSLFENSLSLRLGIPGRASPEYDCSRGVPSLSITDIIN